MKEHKKEDIDNYIDKLDEVLSGKDIISGIHNYCDRWCERCTKTKHCSVFQMEQMTDESSKDIENEEFWDNLSLTYAASAEILYRAMEKFDIDIDDLEDVEVPEHKETELEKIAEDYSFSLLDWLKNNDEKFTEILNNSYVIDEKQTLKLNDAIDVVNWYSVFISAKIHRAMHTVFNDGDDYDNLGSAKIAIIAVQRSIEAFNILYHHAKQFEDDILNFLVQLSKIKSQLQKHWPKAMQFKRPGFDD